MRRIFSFENPPCLPKTGLFRVEKATEMMVLNEKRKEKRIVNDSDFQTD